MKRKPYINVLSNIYPYYVLRRNRELYVHREITLLSKQFPEIRFFLVQNISSIVYGNLKFILFKAASKVFPNTILAKNPKWLTWIKNFNYVSESEIERKNIDVLYTHEYFPSNLSQEVVPIIFDTRWADNRTVKNYGYDIFYSRETEIWMKKFCIDRSTLVTITTPEDADRLLSHIPDAKDKIRIVPWYLPELEPVDRSTIINKHEENTVRMLFIGNDAYRKGLDSLLKMLEKYESWFKKEGVEIFIVSNFRDDIHLKHQAEKLVDNGLRLEIFSDMPWQDAQKLMHSAHFFVFPTRADTYGLVLIEAMAAGTAIITSTNSPQRWIVNYGKCGLSVNCDDINQLFDSVKRLVCDKRFRVGIALSAHDRFLNVFYHKAVGERLKEVFEEAVELGNMGSKEWC